MSTKSSARLVGWAFCGLALASGAVALWASTLGFSAFTSYSYALKMAGPLPRVSPNFTIIDQFGHESTLDSMRGRYVLLHAFYGSCKTVCPLTIAQIRDIYSDLPSATRNRLVILSLSIDPVHDTTEIRNILWRELGSVPGWVIAAPTRPSVDQVAQQFGIWVFAKRDGTFNHSVDLFLIDPNGQIIHVIAPQLDPNQTRQQLEKYL